MTKRYRALFDASADFFAENEEEAIEIANKRIPRGTSFADLKELKKCEACDEWIEPTDCMPEPRFCWKHYKFKD